MKVSPKGVSLIQGFEECKLTPYLDQAKIPTIGWGTIVYPSGKHVTMQDQPILQHQADIYLQYDVDRTAAAVWGMVPSNISQNQFDALVSFAYNVGTGGLHGSTLLKAVQWELKAINGPKPAGIREAFLMWDKVRIDGKLVESAGLKFRRGKEADYYLS